MKFRIFIFSILLLNLFSCKKESAPESETWIKFFGGCTSNNEGDVKAVDILYSPTQDKIVTISVFSDPDQQNYPFNGLYSLILITDREGKFLVEQKLDPIVFYGYPKKVLETNRNTLLVILNTKENIDDYQGNQCKMVEISFDGFIISTYDFNPFTGFNYYIQDAVFNSAGELLVTGLTTNVNTNKNGWSPAYTGIDVTDIYIAKFTENYYMIWERTLGYLNMDKGFTIEPADQDYIVTAAINNNFNKSIMRISETGGIIKENNYYLNFETFISASSYLGNDNVLSILKPVVPLEFSHEILLNNLDATTPVSFAPIGNDGNFQPNFVKKINDQKALVCGKSYSAGAFWVLNLDSWTSDPPQIVGIERSNNNFTSLVKFIQDPQNPNYIFVLANSEKTTVEGALCSNLMLMRMENPVK